jgi:hypothetical protein
MIMVFRRDPAVGRDYIGGYSRNIRQGFPRFGGVGAFDP